MAQLLEAIDMESPNVFNYWTTYNTTGTPAHTQDTSTFVSGTSSIKVDGSGGACDAGQNQGASVNPNLVLLPVGQYTFSGWIKTDSSVTNAHLVIRENTGFAALQGWHISGLTNWTYYEGTFNMTSAINVDVLFGLGSYGSASAGIAWFDDIRLVRNRGQQFTNDGNYLRVGSGMGRSEMAN